MTLNMRRFLIKTSLAVFLAGFVVTLRGILYHDTGAALAVFSLIVMILAVAAAVMFLTAGPGVQADKLPEAKEAGMGGSTQVAVFPAPQPTAAPLNNSWQQHFLHLINPEKGLADKIGLALSQLSETFSDCTFLYYSVEDCNLRYLSGSRLNSQHMPASVPVSDNIVEEMADRIHRLIDLHIVRRSETFSSPLTFATGTRQNGGLLLPVAFFSTFHGILAVISAGDSFSRDRSQNLESFCNGLALLCENHELFHASAAAKQTEAENMLAKSLFAEMLPHNPGAIRGWEIAQLADHAPDHSGDFHAYLNVPGEKLMIIIGKCSGRGLSAALFLTRFKAMLSCLLESCPAPADLLNRLSAYMNTENMHDLFATAAAMMIKAADRSVILALAGHPVPLINRTRSGYVEIPQLESGVPLGLFNKGVEPYKNQTIQLLPGDGILLYTEGVTEFPSGGRERLGLEDLRLMLDRLPEESAGMMLGNLAEQLKLENSGRETAEDHTLIYAKSE